MKFFQATRSVGVVSDHNNNISNRQQPKDLKDLFVSNAAVGQGATPTNISINITDVAWSFQQNDIKKLKKDRSKSNDFAESSYSSGDDGVNLEKQRVGQESTRDPLESIISVPDDLLMADGSLIAAAGSNGVVVVWRTSDILGGFGSDFSIGGSGKTFGNGMNRNPNQPINQFLFMQHHRNQRGGRAGGESNTSSTTIGQPEAIIVEHTRAVNRIAWHRHKPGVFLTASQDATVKLFERREVEEEKPLEHGRNNKDTSQWRWFGKPRSSSMRKTYTWHCMGCFKTNNGPIQDIQWSPSDQNLFAMVTYNGFLVVHNMQMVSNNRPIATIAAHAGAATTIDWHPNEAYIVATGSTDRSVKGRSK